MDDIIASIDVGTTKICTLIAQVDARERLRIIGVGIVPSRGLRKGAIVNVEEATQAIAQSIQEAEQVAGYNISSACVGIAGSHISSITSRGVAMLGRGDHPIVQEDINRAMEAAQTIAIPHDRQVLHAIPRGYIIDGQDGVRDPIGMIGYRLEVETHIVTASTASIKNLVNCVKAAGIQVSGLVLQPLASAESALRPEEKQMGVVLVDMGGGTTDIAIFMEGSVWHSLVLAVGGDHITNDVAFGLRTSFDTAEELKVRYGHALPSQVSPEEMINVSAFGDGASKPVSRRELCHIINARAEEMVDMVSREIKRTGYDGLLAAGVVLTGGTAELAGLPELFQERLKMPVRVGTPRGIGGMVAKLKEPAYATATGLLQWASKSEPAVKQRLRAVSGGGRFWAQVKEWLRLLSAR
ncbi:MAG: cell division protein FtsA [Chloroflexi bacterium]|mgnify:CR=1 FL=1|nr:cell division protein FtsA [Chloroflexota bacterium]